MFSPGGVGVFENLSDSSNLGRVTSRLVHTIWGLPSSTPGSPLEVARNQHGRKASTIPSDAFDAGRTPPAVLIVVPRLHKNFHDLVSQLQKGRQPVICVATKSKSDAQVAGPVFSFLDAPLSKVNKFLRAILKKDRDHDFEYRGRFPSLSWVIRFIRSHDPDLVLTRVENRSLRALFIVATRFMKLPLVTYRQEILRVSRPKDRSIYPLSEGLREEEFPVNFFPLAIDVEKIEPKSSHWYRPRSGPIRLISVGKLIPRKGHAVLLDALHSIRDNLDFELTIFATESLYGASSYASVVKNMIQELGLSHCVRVVHKAPRSVLLEAYRKHHVYVYPGWVGFREDSLEETYGRATGNNGTLLYSLLESMAAGLPSVVAAEKYVVGSVKNGESGLLFSKRSSWHLGQRLLELSNLDLVLMGREARRIAEVRHAPAIPVKQLGDKLRSATFARGA